MTPTKLKKPRKPKAAEIHKTKSDSYGNLLYIKNNGKRIILSLKLVSETRKRRVGTINIAQKVLECRRVREKHLFRKGNAYGFNEQILRDARKFDKIRLIDNYEEWLIPVSFILEKKNYLHFLGQGFERQIFANMIDIEEFKKDTKI